MATRESGIVLLPRRFSTRPWSGVSMTTAVLAPWMSTVQGAPSGPVGVFSKFSLSTAVSAAAIPLNSASPNAMTAGAIFEPVDNMRISLAERAGPAATLWQALRWQHSHICAIDGEEKLAKRTEPSNWTRVLGKVRYPLSP